MGNGNNAARSTSPAASSRDDAPAKIAVRQLTKIFGPRAGGVLGELHRDRSKADILAETGHVVGVRNASFEVRSGEIFVLMGLSGSGKSTLVRMLNRLIDPTRGEVLIDGADITRMSRKQLVALRRRDIAMVFQSFALMPHLTAFENAAFGLRVAGIKESQRRQRVDQALETVGLTPYAGHLPRELSGGMRQRVGLARALALNPTIMLMDEAFSALDPLIRTDMQDELLRIQRERNITVVFVSHDLNEAIRVGDRLAIMDDGEIVQIGTPRGLVLEPANERVRSFLRDTDVRRVLTARDIAGEPPAMLMHDTDASLDEASRRLETEGELYLHVIEPDGRYAGIVSRDSLRLARDDKRHELAAAFLTDVPRLSPDEPFARTADIVSGTRMPVPVVDEAGRLIGVVSAAAMLKASGGKG
jgi:glycine betaine/proline transport system ATP-binding protein